MQYMLLIYENESASGSRPKDEMMRFYAEYTAFSKEISASGHFRAGDGLQATSTATTVRVREGKTLTTDGPFAETREQLAGYYLVEAKDLDTAVGLAARIPEAKEGSIEVRPVMIYK